MVHGDQLSTRGNLIMDHDMVVREKMTEKYLLKELDPEVRDEFEEHFFDCPECARDVRAGSEFVELSKIILEQKPEKASELAAVRQPEPAWRGWLAWLRPAVVVPMFAMLLVVIGYQNFVEFPQLTQAVNRPQVLPAATVNLLTYGANAAPLAIHAGEGFLLNVIIPPDHRYSAYKVDLYNPAGSLEESVPVAASNEDTWPIQFPGANRQSGTYKLKVHGVSSNGQDVEVGSGSFELQIQK
jgi:anti-sigma factor RsiW